LSLGELGDGNRFEVTVGIAGAFFVAIAIKADIFLGVFRSLLILFWVCWQHVSPLGRANDSCKA
jgi:hypothetical protein